MNSSVGWLIQWYRDHPFAWNTLYRINQLHGKNEISLRLLDFFVTKYTKYVSIKYANMNGKPFDVHGSYRTWLKVYHKTDFDPFRRGITFYFDGHSILHDNFRGRPNVGYTTVAQLRFFHWAIDNQVIEYVQANREVILLASNTLNHYAKNSNPMTTSRYDLPITISVQITHGKKTFIDELSYPSP
jgi:hypothetical protein